MAFQGTSVFHGRRFAGAVAVRCVGICIEVNLLAAAHHHSKLFICLLTARDTVLCSMLDVGV